MEPETLSIVVKSLNTAGLFIVAFGLWMRRRPRVHIPVMLTAFGLDLITVLLVEVLGRTGSGKGAVEQGFEAMTGPGSSLARFHIAVSVLCLVGYIVAAITGTRLYRRGKGRTAHKVNAGVFLVTRLSSYVTSFWM